MANTAAQIREYLSRLDTDTSFSPQEIADLIDTSQSVKPSGAIYGALHKLEHEKCIRRVAGTGKHYGCPLLYVTLRKMKTYAPMRNIAKRRSSAELQGDKAPAYRIRLKGEPAVLTAAPVAYRLTLAVDTLYPLLNMPLPREAEERVVIALEQLEKLKGEM